MTAKLRFFFVMKRTTIGKSDRNLLCYPRFFVSLHKNDHDMTQTERIKTMETRLDQASVAVMHLSAALDEYVAAGEAIRELSAYYGSDHQNTISGQYAMPKIIVAIDSLKGCLSSQEANRAAAEGIRNVWPEAEVVEVPVSDGGEGFLEAFRAAIGGEIIALTVHDPLMRPVKAAYLLHNDTAVIEIAQACGLTLLAEEERNPMVATSYGVGQLVADAVRRGAKHVIVGLGGSATSDAGMGMLRAIVDIFAKLDNSTAVKGCWDDITALKSVRFTIASDVRNPLCGEQGAAYVFGPQKFPAKKAEAGIANEIQALDRRAAKFAELSARHFGFDRSGEAGAGAAGGLGYAFLQYLDAECRPGIDLLLDTIRFKDLIRDADLIITGEGAADRQTLMGKLPMGILRQAGSIPVCLIAGRISDRDALLQAGFADAVCINPPNLPLSEAMRKEVAQRNIARTAYQTLVLHHKFS